MVSLKIFSLVALLVGSSFAAPNLPLPLQERKDEASGSILVRTLDVPAVERGVKFIQRRIPETSITDIESPGGVMLRDSGARKWLAMETDLTIDESAVPGGQNKRQLPDTNPTMANGGDPVPFANGGAMKAKRDVKAPPRIRYIKATYPFGGPKRRSPPRIGKSRLGERRG